VHITTNKKINTYDIDTIRWFNVCLKLTENSELPVLLFIVHVLLRQGLETSSSRALDRPTPQRHWICSCQPLETGNGGATRRPELAIRDDDDDDDDDVKNL